METAFDTPFFVIRSDVDIAQLRNFVAESVYDTAEWVEDKAKNPLCRLGQKTRNLRYPKRVGTICVKKFSLLEQTKQIIEYGKGHSHG